MKRFYSIFASLLFLCIAVQPAFSLDDDNIDLEESVPVPAPKESGGTIVHGLIATGETFLVNGLLAGYNVMFNKLNLGRAAWAEPSADAIRRNFTKAWKWEEGDGFKVNQFGHPYQGSMYFSAGRANGFGFYESSFFNVLGSSTWEAFLESNHASVNDFITTSIGALSLGEVFYRLYLEAYAAGIPVSFLIDPIAGFHRLITGWKPPNYGKNIYQFQFYLGGGYAQADYYAVVNKEEFYSFNGGIADLGFSIIYGNPFEQISNIPFEHFEFDMSMDIDAGNYIAIRSISDGYLFSVSPVSTDADMMSTGLSLHMDFVSQGRFDFYDSTIDQYSNALNWTIKYQHLFSEDAVFQTKFHGGFTFWGVSLYYPPLEGRDYKNYGYGVNSKLFISFEQKIFGKLQADVFGYILWSYPGTSAIKDGAVYWVFADVTYTHLLSKHLSIGVADSFAIEWGIFGNFPNTRKHDNKIKLFVAWDF